MGKKIEKRNRSKKLAALRIKSEELLSVGSIAPDGASSGNELHHSPRKVDATGVPVHGRSLISARAMAVLRKQHAAPAK
jgi:hypothetical protein